MKILLIAIISITSAWAESVFIEETLYYGFQKSILSQSSKKSTTGVAVLSPGISDYEQSLFIDALWDLSEEKRVEAFKALDQLQSFNFNLLQKIRITILRMKYRGLQTFDELLLEDINNHLKQPVIEDNIIFTLAAYEEILIKNNQQAIVDLIKTLPQYDFFAKNQKLKNDISNDIISDLFFNSPDNKKYGNGEFADTLKLFMFCRQDRTYPCLMVMRDKTGKALRNEDGTLWTHPALALSASGKSSEKRNGNTPMGVMKIDSVMPKANAPLTYGKNRRVILKFIEKSANESSIKALLPASSQNESWWKAGTIARDLGRNLLRIHGTGKLNEDETLNYFPFMPTNGCIAQRENTYDEITFQDQRELLDAMMLALGLEATYENETSVKGILYIVELDETLEAVSAIDLKLRGIE